MSESSSKLNVSTKLVESWFAAKHLQNLVLKLRSCVLALPMNPGKEEKLNMSHEKNPALLSIILVG